jgi:oligopeptidase B
MLEDVIPNTSGNIVWANDNQTLFYTIKDDSLRPYKIFRHKLGTPVSEDVEVWHESDETFRTFIYKTKSDEYLIIGSVQTITSEYRFLDANDPEGEFSMLQERTGGWNTIWRTLRTNFTYALTLKHGISV